VCGMCLPQSFTKLKQKKAHCGGNGLKSEKRDLLRHSYVRTKKLRDIRLSDEQLFVESTVVCQGLLGLVSPFHDMLPCVGEVVIGEP
jgi:hypothetical protein